MNYKINPHELENQIFFLNKKEKKQKPKFENIPLQPGPRYYDTAFIIFQQWLHNEFWTSADSNKLAISESNLHDLRATSNGSLKSSSSSKSKQRTNNHSKLGTKSKPKTKTKHAITSETKRKFRRSLSDPATFNELKIIESDNIRKSFSDDEHDGLPPSPPPPPPPPPPHTSHRSTPSSPKVASKINDDSSKVDITVCVDIHEQKINETNNNLIVQKEVPEKPLDELDGKAISDAGVTVVDTNSDTVSRTSSIRSDRTLTGVQMSVPIRRKQIRPIDPDDRVSSSFDESDADPVYEKVDRALVSYFLFYFSVYYAIFI